MPDAVIVCMHLPHIYLCLYSLRIHMCCKCLSDFGKMLEAMAVDRVISVGLQRPGQGQEACFFDNSIPLEDISTMEVTTDYFKENVKLEGPIVLMTPNDECLKKAVKFEKDFHRIYPKSTTSIVATVHRGTSVFKDKAGDFETLGKYDVSILYRTCLPASCSFSLNGINYACLELIDLH